ncbi:MAG: hypothetical protein NTW50_03430 [Candidatus Berkelbacteria bacterium]|nr:hypothetical protein [Candidatus Berkelbacteria bacterium]
MNKNTKAKLIVLTDGANNQPPYNEDGTSQVYRTFNHPQDWVTTEKILVYFRTDLVVSEEQFVEIADACGFNELIIFDQHKTNREALRKEIRRVIHLLSNRRAFGHQSMPDGILTHTFEPCTSW